MNNKSLIAGCRSVSRECVSSWEHCKELEVAFVEAGTGEACSRRAVQRRADTGGAPPCGARAD